MNKNRHEQTVKMVETAIFAALVVVLQIISYFIKIGPFALTLTLIPVVLGGALLGPKHGAALGFLFGVIVFIFCVNGVDVGGNMLFAANPFLTAVICLVKGTAAGFLSALVYRGVSKIGGQAGSVVGTLLAAVTAPIVNTGLFCIGMVLFFNETLVAWAAGTQTLVYIFTGLIGINFLIEFGLNIVLSPTIGTVIRVVSKKKRIGIDEF